MTVRKTALDKQIAEDLQLKQKNITLITNAFLRVLLHAIVEEREVVLEGFGRFLLREEKHDRLVTLRAGRLKKGTSYNKRTMRMKRMFRVSFRKSPAFREAIWAIYGKATD